MEKVALALDTDGEWPPVATEHVWCEKTGTIYQLKNGLYAVDVPAAVDGDGVNALMDRLEGLGSSMAFSVWRH